MLQPNTPAKTPYYTLSGPPYDLVPLAPCSPTSPSPCPKRLLRRSASTSTLRNLFTPRPISRGLETARAAAGGLKYSSSCSTPGSRLDDVIPTKPLQTRDRLQSKECQVSSPEVRDIRQGVDHESLKTVESEWQAAAKALHSDARECLEGAVCLGVIDPCEGLTREYLPVPRALS
jgi:hypothetical protein